MYERGEETNAAGEKWGSEDEINEPPANVPKITSYQEATSGLQDILHFLETKGNTKTANDLAKVIANVQIDQFKQRRSQSKLKDFFITV